MSTEVPHKRAAFESPTRLAQPTAYDPQMKRPTTTVVGAALVLLRVAAGTLWTVGLTTHLNDVVADGIDLSQDAIAVGIGVIWGVVGLLLAFEIVLALLTLAGRNWPRVLLMLGAVISTSTSFVAWWAQGQEIRIRTTLLTVGLDILVLLALSSRSAAAYARRKQRH